VLAALLVVGLRRTVRSAELEPDRTAAGSQA
jgi:hypothetical protein